MDLGDSYDIHTIVFWSRENIVDSRTFGRRSHIRFSLCILLTALQYNPKIGAHVCRCVMRFKKINVKPRVRTKFKIVHSSRHVKLPWFLNLFTQILKALEIFKAITSLLFYSVDFNIQILTECKDVSG